MHKQVRAVAVSFLGACMGLTACLAIAAKPPGDNMINGERFPDGYTPMEIKNGVYPRAYAPNTEKLGPKEMRVTALGV